MENNYYFLERKIRALESKKAAYYKTLIYRENDCCKIESQVENQSSESAQTVTEGGLSNVNEKTYKLNFYSEIQSSVLMEINFNIEQDEILTFECNKVKVFKKACKNGNVTISETVDVNSGLNEITLIFGSKIGSDLTVKISGYLSKVEDDSVVSVLNDGDKIYICHYDGAKCSAVLYKVLASSLQKLYSVSEVISATISRAKNQSGDIALFTVKKNGNLCLKYFNQDTLTASDANVIATGVSKVSGSYSDSGDVVYYLKNGRVYKSVIQEDSRSETLLDFKNVYNIYSTPNKGGLLIVIGYDKVATLYVS